MANIKPEIIFLIKQGLLLVCVFMTTVTLFVGGWAKAASVAEGYPTDTNLIEGTLVTISNDVPPKVELANLSNSQYLIGVVEKDGQSLLTLNKDGADILVATSGEVFVFVSDLAGDIEPGDFIGTSWVSGVGMKAQRVTEQKLLGVALEPFNEAYENAVVVEDLNTPNGEKTARIGKIAVRLFEREVGPDSEGSVSALERLAFRLAGREVPFVRILAAVGLFSISAIISGVFLTNAIRSSLISIGRNPLAHSSIFASLTQVSGVSIGLVLIGTAIAYMVLIL